MPTEPGILAFLEKCDNFYPPDAVDAPIGQQRLWYNALCAEFSPALPEGLVKLDGEVAGVPVRLYRPAQVKTGVRLVYIHGGGFVVGSLESHDAICAEIADRVGAELTAIDYRLAPEHVWPAQHEDCQAVLDALLADGDRLVLIGDSAGGNLVAGLALRARDEGRTAQILGQALVYPGLGGDLITGSYAEMSDAPGLSTADVRYYREVLQAPEDDAVAFPLRAKSFARLPPTYVTAAHFDPLRDDGRLYAMRLAEAGVEVWFCEEPQMVHAWLRARHMSKGAEDGFDALCLAVSRLAGTI
ncbi:alpha/beta hydrolase [Rhizobium cremeum]|uniref:alpha/beta hydrolase n=1 Tax=Rhizobium cremeum TaxID=2813827 RepID=UPI000DE4FB93